MLIDYALIIGTGYVIGELLTEPIYKKINKFTKPIKPKLTPYELLLGYDDITKNPIIVNFKVTPHMSVSGLSSQGKSRMVEYALKDKEEVYILNAYDEDFTSVKNAKRIIDETEIESLLADLVNSKETFEKPKFIVVDEMLILCRNKTISNYLLEILSRGRHRNIFLIGIAQRLLKNDCSFKDLFNVRCTFKLVESSSYKASIGGIPEEMDTNLQPREFIVYHTKVEKGKTYDVK